MVNHVSGRFCFITNTESFLVSLTFMNICIPSTQYYYYKWSHIYGSAEILFKIDIILSLKNVS